MSFDFHRKDYSLFVGDLGDDVDDLALFDAFVVRYKTVKLAKGNIAFHFG